MRTAIDFWRRSQAPASPSANVLYRPEEVNWMHVALKFALGLILIGNLAAPFAAKAQNLGTQPAFGQAVQGQRATTVEGTVLNVVNWGCNVIAPRSSRLGASASLDGISNPGAATSAGVSQAFP